MEGKINFFNETKGVGIIKKEDGEEIFFHVSGVVSDSTEFLQKGKNVTFEIEEGRKGFNAVDVRDGDKHKYKK